MHTRNFLDPLFVAPAMAEIFSDQARVQRMLDFEAALARAEAQIGIIPRGVVAAIEAQCRVESFDMEALANATASAGNPAIPLVKELTALVARRDPAAANFVHWGATSQDAIDTGLVLQLRAALDHFDADLARLADVLAKFARTHKQTMLAGRTLLQQALPVTLGLKAAGWLSMVERHRERLHELRRRALVLQFGGAAGTLAALGTQGIEVATALAVELRLGLPDTPWHTQRDRVGEAATTLGLLAGTLGKIARDISLMMQSEVAEVAEPTAAGRGGSSSMPHKRNPVSTTVMLAAAARVPALVSTMLGAMVQEHERGVGGWHAEWETLPDICLLVSGALTHTVQAIGGLEVDAEKMRANLDVTHGLICAEALTLALARHMDRAAAHDLIERLCRQAAQEKKHLREALAREPKVTAHLSAAELDRLCDPANYTGVTQVLIERALALHKTKS